MRTSFWVYLLIFIVSQLSALVVMPLVRLLDAETSLFAYPFVVTLLVANVLAIVLFFCFRPRSITWGSTFGSLHGDIGRRTLLLAALAIPAIVLVNLLQEICFPNLPDWVGDEIFRLVMHHPLGLLTVCLLGPLSEELLFRGGVQTDLQLRHADQGRWVPIAVSAALFALVHLNPAQMPAAFVLGLLLGYAYWQTGSLVAPVAIHVINNTSACLLALLAPDSDTLLGLLGSPLDALPLAVLCLLWVGATLHWLER